MKIQNLNYDGYLSNSYLIEVDSGNEVKYYLVDPSVEVNVLKKYVKKLDGILITHAHIDHIVSLKEIYDYYKANVYCHKEAIEKIKDNNKNCGVMFGINKNLSIDKFNIVHDGDIIDGIFKVLETPGHTNCSVCYIIDDCLFSGDTLFCNGVGRTDLYSGSMGELIKSIKRLANLKLDYKVYPGHECYTTLNEERINNEYILRYK